MKAEIISIGTEILLGEITDTNAAYLASQLPLFGIELYWVTQVSDHQERLVEAFQNAWSRSDLIIATGGLGPTEDDRTREAIAKMFGEGLSVDPNLEQWLRGLFSNLNREMSPSNIKQAMIISSARAIPNSRGTAPGWWIEREGRIIVALPGPPGEMQQMWEQEIGPELRRRQSRVVLLARTLKTWGLPEAGLDDMIKPLLSSTNPIIGIYAKPDGIHIRFIAKAPAAEEAEVIISRTEARLRSILSDNIWGTDDDTPEGVAGTLLREQGLTLATMESGTGGLLASAVTSALRSSSYFRGGLVTHSDEMKIAFGVDAALLARYGGLSLEAAEAMASAARSSFGADLGIGVSGVFGPEESKRKARDTVYIAVADRERKRSRYVAYSLQRPDSKHLASLAALHELRRFLLDQR